MQLSVVLCLAYEGDNQLDVVPPHLQELISSYQLSPFITKVGLHLVFIFHIS
jgi:tRNA-specific adenosine deaminase 3